MRWEDVLWDKRLIFVPDGKTETAKRYVPLSDRVRELLQARKALTQSVWVFPSSEPNRTSAISGSQSSFR